MSSLLDTLTSQLSGGSLSQLSRQLGADEGTTATAVSAALPVLLGALARNAAQPNGASALASALDRDHDGSVLDDLGGLFGGAATGAAGAGILKHVLGDKQQAVAAGLGQTTGLDAGKAGALLAMLAPVVMGALGKTQRSQGLDAGGLASMLGQQASALNAQGGAVGGLLSMLDANKDGSVVDDVLGMASKLFGRK